VGIATMNFPTPINPHPSVSDTATAGVKPRIVPAHRDGS
jgi:hypothetical protein